MQEEYIGISSIVDWISIISTTHIIYNVLSNPHDQTGAERRQYNATARAHIFWPQLNDSNFDQFNFDQFRVYEFVDLDVHQFNCDHFSCPFEQSVDPGFNQFNLNPFSLSLDPSLFGSRREEDQQNSLESVLGDNMMDFQIQTPTSSVDILIMLTISQSRHPNISIPSTQLPLRNAPMNIINPR